MDADYDLMRAVKTVIDQWTLPAAEDEVQLSIERMESALTATVAEIRKRRDDLRRRQWEIPFSASADGPLSFKIASANGVVMSDDWVFAVFAEDIAAALNSFYGYDAQGNDLLEGMGV